MPLKGFKQLKFKNTKTVIIYCLIDMSYDFNGIKVVN